MFDKKYQIFISSTYKDLIEAREVIIKAILNMYHIPIGMEMFSADNDEQWETIKTTINFSDYYILIIGHRYGSLSKEGISYTEKEFDYAKEKGIPILAFIRNRDVSTKPFQRETDITLQNKLDSFIEKSSSNAMVDFWDDEKDLTSKILTALFKSFSKSPRTGWVRADKAMSPEVADELAILSKKNRSIKEELDSLKSKISLRMPAFEVYINNTQEINEKFLEDDDLIKKSKYYLKQITEIESSLSRFVNSNLLKIYNATVAENGSEIINYNNDVLKFERIAQNKNSYSIKIKNTGSAKGNNVIVDIEFPDNLLIFNKGEINKIFNGKVPKYLGLNPIEIARKEKRNFESSRSGVLVLPSSSSKAPIHLLDINSNYFIKNNSLKINFNHILHTQAATISQEILIVPLIKGSYNLLFKIICEEFDTPQLINFNLTFE